MEQPHALTGGIKRRESDLQRWGMVRGFVSVGCVLVLGRVKLLRKNVFIFLCNHKECDSYLVERGSIHLNC